MTIEEAIKTLETAIAEGEWNYPLDYSAAFEMAIDALRAQPAQGDEPMTPCDLCIYNPPTSHDGKPCCICPASAKYKTGASGGG